MAYHSKTSRTQGARLGYDTKETLTDDINLECILLFRWNVQYYKRADRRNAAVMCLCYAERSGTARDGWGSVDCGSRLIDFFLSSAAPGNHDNTRLLVVLGMLSAAEDKGAKALSANYSTFSYIPLLRGVKM